MSRDLPPGFVEFTNELARTQSKDRRGEGSGCRDGLFIGVFVWMVALLLSFPAGAALRQVAFDVGPTRTTEAEVVRTEYGNPVVRYTTGDGESVHARLFDSPRDDGSRTLEVVYRVNHPQDAIASDHPRTFAGPVLLLLLAAWVLFELFHRRGLRAGWFWRRARTMAKGPLTRSEQRRPLNQRPGAYQGKDRAVRAPWAPGVVGAVLTLGGLVMIGAALVSSPEIWAMFASVALAFGVSSLRGALYQYADTAPVPNPPRPFRLLPRGAVRWASPVLLVAAIVVTVLSVPTGNEAEPPSSVAEVPGRARIVDDGCSQVRSGSACEAYVVLEYRANGMDYRERVVVDLLGLDELVARETVSVAWDQDDPSQVRLVDP